MKTIHLRINNNPQTLCKKDVADKDVLWTSPESYGELMDGELQGLAACTECVAGMADAVRERNEQSAT